MRGRDPEDGCEGADMKKRAHQELSLRGRRSERERGSKGKRGCEKALLGEEGGFSSVGVSRPAQLQNRG